MKFDDKQLNDIFIENQAAIDAHIDRLNSMSSDIKKFEILLANSAFPADLCFEVPGKKGYNPQGTIIWNGQRLMWTQEHLGSRPLIETPKEVRMHCYKYLAEFFTLCINSIKETK